MNQALVDNFKSCATKEEADTRDFSHLLSSLVISTYKTPTHVCLLVCGWLCKHSSMRELCLTRERGRNAKETSTGAQKRRVEYFVVVMGAPRGQKYYLFTLNIGSNSRSTGILSSKSIPAMVLCVCCCYAIYGNLALNQ